MSFIKYAFFSAVVGSCLVSHYLFPSSFRSVSLNQHVQLEVSAVPCPLANASPNDNDVTQLRQYARTLTHDKYSNMIEAVQDEAFKNSKIVFVGDSNMKKGFSSFASATHSEGLWENDNSFAANDSVEEIHANARFALQDGLGEVFFAPRAGQIVRYRGVSSEFEDWTWNCWERRPFYLNAIAFSEPNDENDTSDPQFERILLREWDIVVFNEGDDPDTKERNLKVYNELQKCIQKATELDIVAGWPQFIHMESDKEIYVEDSGTIA